MRRFNYRARAEAEEMARQLAELSKATMAMNRAADIDALVSAVASGAAAIAQTAATAVVPTGGHHLRRATVAIPGESAPALSSTAPEALARLEAALPGGGPARLQPELVAALTGQPTPRQEPAWALLARSRSGHPPVCLAVHTADPVVDGLADVLVQLGNAAVLAVDAQRLYAEEHSLALTLQRSFLPKGFPEHAGLELAVRYVPAVKGAEISGDFYEVVELDDGQLLVAIGDVAGHSIHAATIMVELRHALRAYAIDHHRPTTVLKRLERLLQHYHPREYATLCLLLLDLERGRLEIANAGHPPPLLVGRGRAAFTTAVGPMLGARLEHPPETVLALDDLETVVLLTDGLIEDRISDIDDAMERLRSWPSLRTDPEALCDDLLEQFGQDESDDIALLVLRLTAGKPRPPA